MLVESLNGFDINLSMYEDYLEAWLNGISSEIGHWRRVMDAKGPLLKYLVSDRQCSLEQYFELPETVCVDIGSGPFSSCGQKTDKTNLRFTAIDPLAHSYNLLKNKHNITDSTSVEFCMVEKLTEKFKRNTFDIVHMRNALDHAFSPIFGIIQMVAICKVGGKIILQHTENEAENENYHGFHQWNLCAENKEFFVWRTNCKYNVSKMFSEYADTSIENVPSAPQNAVGVVMTKKKDIEVDRVLQNELFKILDSKIFEKLLEYSFKEAYSTKANIISAVNRIPFVGKLAKQLYKKLYRNRKA